MSYHNFEENLHEVSNKLLEFGENKLDYYKLTLYKAIMKMARSLFLTLLFGAIILLIFFFLSFGLAYLIGQELGNIAFGYFIIAGFYILILILVIAFGKRILERKILMKTSEWFVHDEYKNQK